MKLHGINTTTIVFLFLSILLFPNTILSISNPSLESSFSSKTKFLLEKGYESLNKGQYDLAINYFEKAIEINPDLAAAYYNRGLSWDHKHDLEKALKDYTKAIDIDPRNEMFYNNRAFVHLRQKKCNLAIFDFNRAIEINPRSFRVLNNRGLCYHQIKRYDRAISDFTKGLQSNPNFLDLYINRGTVYSEIGANDQAILDFSEAIKISPTNTEALYKRAVSFGNTNNFDKAIDDYTNLLAKYPYHPGILNNRGVAWKKLGKYRNAIDDYTKCIEYNEKTAAACNNSLAWLLATCPDSTFRNGKQAIEIATDLVKYQKNEYHLGTLAAAYAEVGKFEDAISAIKDAIIMFENRGDLIELNDHREQMEAYKSKKPWREK